VLQFVSTEQEHDKMLKKLALAVLAAQGAVGMRFAMYIDQYVSQLPAGHY
jgi:hypothetical protein